MNEELTIRYVSATNKDVGAIRGLVFGVLEEYGLVPEPNGTDTDIADVEVNYIGRGGLFELLLDQENKIVGTVGLFPMDSGVVELRKMYFVPGIRGKGLGKRTLSRMIGAAKELGFKKIYLETASPLVEAIGLYKSFGFSPTCDIHTERCDQAYFLPLD